MLVLTGATAEGQGWDGRAEPCTQTINPGRSRGAALAMGWEKTPHLPSSPPSRFLLGLPFGCLQKSIGKGAPGDWYPEVSVVGRSTEKGKEMMGVQMAIEESSLGLSFCIWKLMLIMSLASCGGCEDSHWEMIVAAWHVVCSVQSSCRSC